MADRVGVLGAGGMGSAFAAHLARSGENVVLIGRGSAHIHRLTTQPLRVDPPGAQPWFAPLAVAESVADVPDGSLDILLLLTKAYDLAEAASAAAPLLGKNGVAVALQNGLGTDALTADAFGGDRSLVGTTTVGARLMEPGQISVSTATAAGRSTTSIGPMGRARGSLRHARRTASLLTTAGLPSGADNGMDQLVWGKLALASMSPISCVNRVTVAAVWASPEGRNLVRRMFDEVVDVAAAEGVHLDRDRAWAHAMLTFDGTGEHFTSMCTDFREGRRTELPEMAGTVAVLAERHGIAAPVHHAVLDLLAIAGDT